MTSYYNELDKNCCALLRRQIQFGNLLDGFVDERSIVEVQPDDIKQYNEAHFFAGIGGFALGFARAGIPSNSTVWTGGFPCQDLSVAGKRAGLAGERSGLYFEFHRLITANYPEWVVLENVPGLLSSNEGRDFAIVIGGLTGIIPEVPAEGWGNAGLFRGPIYNVAYRVLDAQFFGVPQRRRRVFIVGSLGNGRSAEVLFEREGMSGDPPARGEEGKEVAFSLRSNPSHSGDKGDGGINTTLIGFNHKASSARNMPIVEDGTPSLETNHQGMAVVFDGRNMETHEKSPTLQAKNNGGYSLNYQPMVFQQNTRDEVRLMGGDGKRARALAAQAGMKQQNYVAFGGNNTSGPIDRSTALNAHGGTGRHDFESETLITYGVYDETTPKISEDVMPTLRNRENGGGFQQAVGGSFGVRRLTPTECERLQGFPDGWTDGQSDSARYRQLGNAVAVPVVEWIGKRIMENDQSPHLA